MLEDALRYPYGDGAGAGALLVGVLLTLLGFLLLPLVLVAGYTLRVARAGVAGEAMPAWDDWAALFVDGLRAIAVAVAYLLVPGVLVVGTLAAVFVALPGPVPRVVTVVAWVVAVLSVPALLAALYVLPAALVNVALVGRTGAGFALRRLWPVLASETYAVAWLLALVVSVLGGAVAGVVALVPVVGVVVGAAVGFYVDVVATYLYARGVADATAGIGPRGR
ncbi:MAG: DUF4013 domain-containing protein [Haloarculaceae archaeon]